VLGSSSRYSIRICERLQLSLDLPGAHLGSADEEARTWLLLDQTQQLLYLAVVEEARRFLAAQWPRYDAPQGNIEAELARLLEDDWREESLSVDWHDRLAETVRESRANYALMLRWLEQQHGVER